MSVELSGAWRTTADEDAVWEVVRDLDRWREWWPALTGVRTGAGQDARMPDEGAPQRVELVFDTVVGELTVPVTVEPDDHARRFRVSSDGGGFVGSGDLAVETDDRGSRVTYRFSVKAKRLWLKPVEAVLRTASSTGRGRLREAGDRLAELAGGDPLDHEV